MVKTDVKKLLIIFGVDVNEVALTFVFAVVAKIILGFNFAVNTVTADSVIVVVLVSCGLSTAKV